MSYDARKVTYQEVTIFDRPALFTEYRIDRATVPEGVYRYELRHGDEDWGEPIELSRSLMVNFYGTVLTREPFQLPIDGWIPLESGNLSFQDGGCRTLAEFQEKYPASEKDVIDFYSVNEPALHDLYFSRSEEQDKSAGCVGHLRGDFGSGKQFYTTWWPHQHDALNTPEFKADIDRTVNWLREQPDSPLRDFDSMNRYCNRYEQICTMQDGFQVPNLLMPQTPEVHLGKYAELRREYLKKHRRVLYTNLKTSGKLTEHLAEIEQTARKMVEQTVAQMAQAEGVTEELKATDPLRWTGLMNNLRHSAEELVLSDLIYA